VIRVIVQITEMLPVRLTPVCDLRCHVSSMALV
jgi:hypothetical protein